MDLEYLDSSESEDSLEDTVVKFKEYGDIYQNVKSEFIKEKLLKSMPPEVLQAFAVAAKNILIENIKLTPEEFDIFKPHKERLKELGFRTISTKKQRQLLAEGNLFNALSTVMSKLSAPRTAYQFRGQRGRGINDFTQKMVNLAGDTVPEAMGFKAIARAFNPSGKRRPAGFARAILMGRSKKIKKDYIKKHGAGSWFWG